MSNKRKETATALLNLAEKSRDQKQLAEAIALYLTQNRQTKELDGLMRDMVRMRSDNGITEATVVSAHPISAKLKSDLKAMVAKTSKADKVILNETIDPSVIGGVRIETNEQQLDITVRAKLNKLKQATV